jgi:hypothetical protein
MAQQASAFSNGTYSFSLVAQKNFIGITKALSDGIQQIVVKGQGKDLNYSSSTVSICVWESPPTQAAFDCTTGAQNKAVPLTKLKSGVTPVSVDLDETGTAVIGLASPLSVGEFISVVQASIPVAAPKSIKSSVSSQAYGVVAPSQCNSTPFKSKTSVPAKYSDCDFVLSLMAESSRQD